jgi:hypothetical protein
MKELIGKTISTAIVNGSRIELTFTDGTIFAYEASDGGYSTYGYYLSKEEYLKNFWGDE